jgi:hypothetical protein
LAIDVPEELKNTVVSGALEPEAGFAIVTLLTVRVELELPLEETSPFKVEPALLEASLRVLLVQAVTS